MSTTGPMTWTTLPIFCFVATSVAIFLTCLALGSCLGSGPGQKPTAQSPGPTLPCRRGAGHDLDNFARNRRLANLIHIERERVDNLARVLRRGVHRRHARGMLRSSGLEQRAIH